MRLIQCLAPVLVLAACSPSADGVAQPAPPLPAPSRVVPASQAQVQMSYAPVVKKAIPAVVNISAKRMVRTQVDPFWEMFGMGAPPGRIQGSLGSGAIVRADGVIVTNNHVIEGGQEITVSLADRREFAAKVLLADARSDLAILKIDPGSEKLPTLAIDDTGQAQVGDLVLAIGDPFGVGQTVTSGIISALNRSADPSGEGANAYIQTDAAINPGNSGGPLVDMDGDIIGINSFIVSRSGGSVGVGFAIPGALVKRAVETAAGGGHALVRPWLGTRVQPVTSDVARSLGLKAPRGVLVADLWPGSAAERAGVRQGDVIVSIDGRPLNDEAGLNSALSTRTPGQSISLVVLRDGTERQISAPAEVAPSSPARDQRLLDGNQPLQGAVVLNVSPSVAEELGIDPFANRGVLVVEVKGGYSRRLGVRPGDVIRAINGKPVSTVKDVSEAVSAGGRDWAVTILRGGRTQTARVRL